MSRLTTEVMRRPKGQKQFRRWHRKFSAIADRLLATYGVPRLGNFDDPVDEVFFIVGIHGLARRFVVSMIKLGHGDSCADLLS